MDAGVRRRQDRAAVKVLHVLAALNPSGAERMLECSLGRWHAAGIDPVIVGMSDRPHPFAPILTEVGYKVVLLPDVRSFRGLAALGQTLRAVKPHIVHVHTESCHDAVALLATVSPGVQGIVHTVHNNFRFTGFLRARRTIRVAFARRLGVVRVACSPEVAQTERSYFPHRPTQVIENWIDVDSVERGATKRAGAAIRRELGIELNEIVLALIGNCGGAKNHELIPSALRSVDGRLHLLHVGHTTEQSTAEANAWCNLSGQHTVHHLGARDDVPALLAASDVLLLPSLYEGLPLIAIEALCARVPLLAADTVGLQWLKSFPSVTFLPFEPLDWAAAIAETVAPGPSREATEIAAAAAQDRFGSERGVAEYLDAYSAALRIRPLLRRSLSRLTPTGEASG
jgi:glycosyltransferase involved in cell wall biosynthesis